MDCNATDVTVDIPHGLTTVHVFETGVDLSDVPVYLFTETGVYLGRQEHTDSYGIVTFFIPQGTYKFRVDHGGNQIWSDVIYVIANEETTVEMDLDVLVSDLTTNPNPVRFDGAPPKYEREKIMLATLGSLTGIFPQLVEGQTTVGKLNFYINDHLGTQRVMTDDAGAVVWRADYKPFGEVVVEPGSIAANKFRFAGQYFDQETGLHYNYHRYYDPKIGRYLRADPIGLKGGINLYSYADNNPVNWVDQFGLTRLYFDRKSGYLFVDPERGQGMKGIYIVLATSGRSQYMNNPAFEHLEDKGPIPAGNYTADIDDLTNPNLFRDILRRLKGDWGDWRVPLEPCEDSQSDRSGFFLHCGDKPGSAGCIDVGGGIFGNENTDRLLNDLLSDPNKIVPVEVW